jgi:hypothetical protein
MTPSRIVAAIRAALAAIVFFVTTSMPVSRVLAAPNGWQYGPNAPPQCNNPDAPPDCPTRWQLYPVPTQAIPEVVKESQGRCSAYNATTVICQNGPPPCTSLSATSTCLKGSVTKNVYADTLVGTFWVQAPPQPDQEVAVRISVNSNYASIDGSVVLLRRMTGKPSQLATQAKVQHFAGSYDITIVSLYFPKIKKWLRCTDGCTHTLSQAPGY